MIIQKILALLGIVAVASSLTACFTPPNNPDLDAYKQAPEEQDEAGFAGASVVAIMSLEQAKSSFTNTYTLTYSEALNLVNQYARSQQQAKIDSFQAGLEIGLTGKNRTGTRTTTENQSGGTSTTTINQTITVNYTPGQPGSATLVIATPTPASRTDIVSATVTINPALAHQAADQLMKLTTMMKNQFNSIPHGEDEEVYIVQVKAGLQPYKPLLPLDAYIHITVLPDLGNTSTLSKPPRIVPIAFGSEEYEFSSSGVSDGYLRGLSLGLNASESWGGLNARTQQMLSSLSQVSATDVNGLIVSVPFSPNSIQIRLGAMWQGSAERAMIPRNFNGFFAVIVNRDAYKTHRQLTMMTKTYFRKPVNGKYLEGTLGSEIVNDIRKEFATYNLGLIAGCAFNPPNESKDAWAKVNDFTANEDWFAFLNRVRRNDLKVINCLRLTNAVETTENGKRLGILIKEIADAKTQADAPRPLLEKFLVSLNKIALKDRTSYSMFILPKSKVEPEKNKESEKSKNPPKSVANK